jgi:hypothetical protein
VVKHKIKCIWNSEGIFHFEAGASVRQVADHAIDHRLAERGGARYFGALASVFPSFDFPARYPQPSLPSLACGSANSQPWQDGAAGPPCILLTECLPKRIIDNSRKSKRS